jgi:hypothetical protein
MSSSVSGAIPFFSMSEPCLNGSGGIYLGRTTAYLLPFAVRHNDLLNPHIAIVGMTGSGKSFLLKNTIIRASEFLGMDVFIIDWNGEYRNLASMLGGRFVCMQGGNPSSAHLSGGQCRGVTLFDLSLLQSDGLKAQFASMALEWIVRRMRRGPMRGQGCTNAFVVIDEAWKALQDRNVGLLYREGRKYGFGIITATQLVGDVHNEILSNSACSIFFRIQNAGDYSMLSDMGLAGEAAVARLGSLEIGSCMVSIIPKTSSQYPRTFFVKRIEGLEQGFCTVHYSARGNVSLPVGRMVSCLEGIAGAEEKGKLSAFIDDNQPSIDLLSLVRALILIGIDRAGIIVYLRRLGIPDAAIVDSYEKAITKK